MAAQDYIDFDVEQPVSAVERTFLSELGLQQTARQYFDLGFVDCETVGPFAESLFAFFAVVRNGTEFPQFDLDTFEITPFSGLDGFVLCDLLIDGASVGSVEVGYVGGVKAFGPSAISIPFPIVLGELPISLNWTFGSSSGNVQGIDIKYDVEPAIAFNDMQAWVNEVFPECYIPVASADFTGFRIAIPLTEADNVLGLTTLPLRTRIDLVNHAKSLNIFSFLK